MATPNPVPSSPPASPPAAPLTTTQAALPTFGAVVGGALGAWLVSKVAPHDPLLGDTIRLVATGAITGAFHWVGTKLGGLTI